eukprot:Anaeramoba_ignava/a608017_40.p3 GENE.a608017_40~~a608017_40.p3  ORF type:complete len:201 (-),score=59.13 a608017_40:2180-2782(-)
MKNEEKQIPVEHEKDSPKSEKEKKKTAKKKKPSLKETVSILEKEKQEIKDKYLRTAAEFENYRRRSNEEKADWIKNATQKLVLEVCDVLDNFERAIITGKEKHTYESLMTGIEMIFKQLESVLKKEGVEKIEALGEEFDPMYHEALAQIPSEHDKNKVAAIIQNGYKMNNKIIRPVRVAVSNGETPVLENNENKQKDNKK